MRWTWFFTRLSLDSEIGMCVTITTQGTCLVDKEGSQKVLVSGGKESLSRKGLNELTCMLKPDRTMKNEVPHSEALKMPSLFEVDPQPFLGSSILQAP